MGIYVTRDDLLAADGSLVWNMAIDKATNQLDETKIATAIEDADRSEEHTSELQSP